MSAIFCIFVVHEGCLLLFEIHSYKLQVDITFWGAKSQFTPKWNGGGGGGGGGGGAHADGSWE